MKLKRFYLPLIGILLTGTLKSQSDSTMSFSLSEAQNYAVENYYVSENAKLDITAAKKRVWETTAIGLPHVSGELNYQHVPGDIPELSFGMDSLFGWVFGAFDRLGETPPDELINAMQGTASPIAQRNNTTYNILVTQLIFSGEYIVGLRAARAYKTLSVETNEKIELEIKQAVANGYFALLNLKETRNIVEKSLNNTRTIENNTRKYYNAGLLGETDADQITLMRKSLESQLNSLEKQLLYLDKLFKYSIGLDANSEIELTDDIETLIGNSIVSDSSYVFLLENNVDYRLLINQENLMKLAMDREKSKYLPTVSGFYRYSDQTNAPALDFTINHVLGVTISVPIFESGSKMMKVQQARIDYIKAQNQKEQESQKLIADANQAQYDYESALENYYVEKESFELSEKILNKTQEKFNNGMTSSIDLTTINNQYLQAQLDYSIAVQELLNAKVKLDKIYNQL